VNIPPQLSGVATLPCEIWMYEKLTIISSKRVGKRKTLDQDHGKWSVRCYVVLWPISRDIWRVERSVCFCPSWLYRLTSSSTVVTFSSVRASFSLRFCACGWCFMFPEFLHATAVPVGTAESAD